MTPLVTDTHAVIWYVLDAPSLSPAARTEMQHAAHTGNPIYVPSIVLVEVVYLVEKGKIPLDMLSRLVSELEDDQSVLTLASLDLQVARYLPEIPRDQVPDMPDRIIAATALALNLPLVTRDHKIRLSSVHTIW